MTTKQKISTLIFFLIVIFSIQDSNSQNSWSISQFNEALTIHKKALKLHNLYNEKSFKDRTSCAGLNLNNILTNINLYKKARDKYKKANREEQRQKSKSQKLINDCKFNIKVINVNLKKLITRYNELDSYCESSKLNSPKINISNIKPIFNKESNDKKEKQTPIISTQNDFSTLENTNKANRKWALVMSKGTGAGSQSWATRSYFPKEKIKEQWTKGRYISSLTYGKGEWALVMSKDLGYYSQTCETYTKFPKDAIKEGWDNGRQITSISYGNGKWALVMSKGSKFKPQSWLLRSYFPKNKIKEYMEKGKYITSLSYGNGMWAVVLSKGTGYSNQLWRTGNKFPEDDINKGWRDGYSITSLTFGNKTWALVMSKGAGYSRQTWNTSSNIPKDFIKKHWDDGYSILSLTNGQFN